MRVLVSGDRKWANRALLFTILDEIHADYRIARIIQGTAPGADTQAAEWADLRGVGCDAYPALWDRYGRAAGPVRNRQMLEEGQPDLVVAFHSDLTKSKGTADMIRQARRAGVEVRHFTGVEPRRV